MNSAEPVDPASSAVLPYERPQPTPRWLPAEVLARVAYAVFGIIAPMTWAFVFGALESLGRSERWQDGKFNTFTTLFFEYEQFWPMLALQALSALALLAVVALPDWASRRFFIRWLVYAGMILALLPATVLCKVGEEYWGIGVGAILALAIAIGLHYAGRGLISLLKRVPPKTGWIIVAIVPLAPILLWGALLLTSLIVKSLFGDSFLGMALVPIVVIILTLVATASAPLLSLACYITASRRLFTSRPHDASILPTSITAIVWSGIYGTAWYEVVHQTLRAYAALPTTAPRNDCYVCTAAAQGHPRLVGSWVVPGTTWRVNRQLQILKAGEIVLRIRWRRFHRALRRIYDFLGPRLARRLNHPLLADTAYLALKPIEWITHALLCRWLPSADTLIGRLYSNADASSVGRPLNVGSISRDR